MHNKKKKKGSAVQEKLISLVHWTSSSFQVSGGGGLEGIERLLQYNLRSNKLKLFSPEVIGEDDYVAEVYHLRFFKKYDPIYLLLTAFSTINQIVITFNYPLIAIMKPRSTIIIFQNYLTFNKRNVFFPLYTLFKCFYHKTQVVVCSKFLFNDFVFMYPKFPLKNLHCIPNAINTLNIHKRVDNFHSPIRLVFAGQWSREKGVGDLLEACDILLERNINFELHIVGGNVWNSKQVITIPKRKYITVVGKLSNQETLRYFEEMDIMIVPSKWEEPFGIVAIEGMLKGLIVITSGKGGLGDIVTHEKTGFINKPGVENLADIIEDVMSMKLEKINRIRKNAYKNVLVNYSQEKYLDRLNAVINRIS